MAARKACSFVVCDHKPPSRVFRDVCFLLGVILECFSVGSCSGFAKGFSEVFLIRNLSGDVHAIGVPDADGITILGCFLLEI